MFKNFNHKICAQLMQHACEYFRKFIVVCESPDFLGIGERVQRATVDESGEPS